MDTKASAPNAKHSDKAQTMKSFSTLKPTIVINKMCGFKGVDVNITMVKKVG